MPWHVGETELTNGALSSWSTGYLLVLFSLVSGDVLSTGVRGQGGAGVEDARIWPLPTGVSTYSNNGSI